MIYQIALCAVENGEFTIALAMLREAERFLKDHMNALIFWKRAIDIRAGFIVL